ncbi:hypothetical protein, partial [Burkholderia metallica]|uniref:hypothetical protein n=1 Tax=Burkholderia metallica TaxID=488729 RepID=UPI00384E4DCD
EFRVQVQALARFYSRFFLTFAWHNVAPWPSVYASHTKVRIGSTRSIRLPNCSIATIPLFRGFLPELAEYSQRLDTAPSLP